MPETSFTTNLFESLTCTFARMFRRRASKRFATRVPSLIGRFQTLESREVPAINVDLTNSILTVRGSDSAETIRVSQTSGKIKVEGVNSTYSTGRVAKLVIDGKGGNDRIFVGSTIKTETIIYGGNGNDTIIAGSGNDSIFGGKGDDVLNGGSGNDYVYGNGGSDKVFGGSGRNPIVTDGNPVQNNTLDAMSREIVRLVNKERQKRGLKPVAINGQLTAAARIHADQMASRANSIAPRDAHQHELLGTLSPSVVDRLDYVGYDWTRYGENIAYGYSNAQAVHTAWMNSASHRKNILDPNLKEIGVAIAKNNRGVTFFAQEFGTR